MAAEWPRAVIAQGAQGQSREAKAAKVKATSLSHRAEAWPQGGQGHSLPKATRMYVPREEISIKTNALKASAVAMTPARPAKVSKIFVRDGLAHS